MVNLQQARIPLRKLSTAPEGLRDARQLQALLSSRAELKYTAQRAFVSYVRRCTSRRTKKFDASALPLAEYAASLGLLAAPRVRLTGGGKLAGAKGGTVDPKKGGTNWAAAAAEAAEEGAQRRRAFIDGDDDGSDGDGSDGDEAARRRKRRRRRTSVRGAEEAEVRPAQQPDAQLERHTQGAAPPASVRRAARRRRRPRSCSAAMPTPTPTPMMFSR